MTDYRQLAVACQCRSASKKDIEVYIQSVVEGEEEYDNRIFEVYDNSLDVMRVKMLEFIHISFPEFQMVSGRRLIAYRTELGRQIGLLLNYKITPYVFSQFFQIFEMALIFDEEGTSADVEFLGDLYNACDWCDETWTLSNSSYLAEEANRVASFIQKMAD